MFAKYLKFRENYPKIQTKMPPDVLAPNVGRITWRPFCMICVEGTTHSKSFGQVWGNWAKIFRTPKHLPAPTPVFQTHTLTDALTIISLRTKQ